MCLHVGVGSVAKEAVSELFIHMTIPKLHTYVAPGALNNVTGAA